MMKSAKAEGSVASVSAAEVAELSEAVQGAERVLDSAKNARPVKIPWGSGVAAQDLTKDAIIARAKVEQKQSLYRIGTRGRSQTGEKAQFWSIEHPNTPGYASRYGIPPENTVAHNFIETATIKENTNFITRTAPPSPDGINSGGGIEVVVSEGGVAIESHISL